MKTISQPAEPIKLLTRLTPAERTLIQLVRDGKAEYAANTARAMADEVLGYRTLIPLHRLDEWLEARS